MVSAGMKKIDDKLNRLEEGSLRHQILTALRQFRASWVELGRLLNEVIHGGDYKEWGYDDFEVYCARELGLKKPTVQKLLVSYNYMKKYEGKRLRDFEEDEGGGTQANIPDFQTVELLNRIRCSDSLPEEEMGELHRKAFDGEVEEPELRRELRHVLRPQDGEDSVRDGADGRRRELTAILRLARELRRKVVSTGAIPGGLKERIERCLLELEALD